jgi:tetratricopeptide (TPR) repeat protein
MEQQDKSKTLVTDNFNRAEKVKEETNSLFFISWLRKVIFNFQSGYNFFIKIPLHEIWSTKNIFSDSSSRFFFLLTTLSFLFLLPFLSKDAGIGDEELHHLQAARVYNYFATLGSDSSALYDIKKDPMQFNGQSFDVITYCIEKIFHVDNYYEMRHFFNALVGWLIILFAGLIAKELIGWGSGSATMIFLFITPFFLGHSYNNNKDIPLALGFIMSLYYIIIYFRHFPKPKFGILFLLCFSIAISISIRLAGILTIGYLGIYAIIFIIKEHYLKKENLKYLRTLIIQLSVISILGYFIGILIWPFALNHPVSNVFVILKAMKEFPVVLGQIFEGNIIWSDQIPWYYVSKYILITVPVIIFIGLALLLFLSKRFINKTNWLELFIVFFSFIFPVIYSAFNHSNDFGCWRHFLFIYPPMVICSVIGYYTLLKIFNNKFVRYVILFFILLGCIRPVIHIIRNHPLEYVYFNEFIGGVDKAYTNYEMDYLQGSRRVASEWLLKYIKKNGEEEKRKTIVAANGSISYYFRHDTANISTSYCKYDNRFYQDWDYMIVCNTYIVPYILRKKYYPPANTIFQVKVDNVPVCVIIERKQKYDYLANKYAQSNKSSEAFDLYKKALSIEPTNIDILLNFARFFISNKKWDSAQKIINYILSIYVDNPDALNLEGIVYKNTNRVPKAIEQFQDIIRKINPNYFQAYYNLGNCFVLYKDYDKALRCFEKCIEINREYKNSYLSIIHILTIQHKTEEAEKMMEIVKSL